MPTFYNQDEDTTDMPEFENEFVFDTTNRIRFDRDEADRKIRRERRRDMLMAVGTGFLYVGGIVAIAALGKRGEESRLETFVDALRDEVADTQRVLDDAERDLTVLRERKAAKAARKANRKNRKA